MDSTDRTHVIFVVLGALAGLAFFAWQEIIDAQVEAARWSLAGSVATGVFFTALLAIAPRVPIARAAGYAAAHGAVLALLLVLASWRYTTLNGFGQANHLTLPVLTLLFLPLPFFIAHAHGAWRDYDLLFDQATQIALRFCLALVLIAVVWLLLFLFELLLALVGLAFMDWLQENDFAIYLINGAAGGLGIAVASTSVGGVGVRLVLALARPLLVPVLAAVALFLAALPFRGLSGLGAVLGQASAGTTMLVMAGVGATLITAVVDMQARATPPRRILALSARLLAGLLPVLAVVAMVALGQRVQQYGWTPERLTAALIAVVGLGYGLLYAAAAPRADWMARLRRANVTLALATMALAALPLTPLLNGERIATASQMARYADGRLPVEKLDVSALERWGIAGQSALATLRAQAKQPGGEALAARLANPYVAEIITEDALAALRAEVQAIIPLQPPAAQAVQSALLADMPFHELTRLKEGCARQTPGLAPACAMLVADFLPDLPGDEALIAYLDKDGELQFYGRRKSETGGEWISFRLVEDPGYVQGEAAVKILRAWQAAPPQLTQVPVLQMQMGQGAVIFLP